jgi:hypothetical protein
MSTSTVSAWAAHRWTASRQLVVRLLVVATVLVGVVRVVLAQVERQQFIVAYGLYKHLDMHSFLGQEVAKREAPGNVDSALFSLLCAGLLTLPLVRRVAGGAPWARVTALVLCAMGGLNTLGSIAVPGPLWYHLLTASMVLLTGLVVLLLWRAPVLEDARLRADLAAQERATR